MKKKEINYLETFVFPDIPGQSYPVYSVSEKGHIFNVKSIIYPNPKSIKKFTRKKQLSRRSTQAKIFDAFINVGYFNPLTVFREFPIIIQNVIRESVDVDGGFFLLDYFFPELMLCVELDSDYHSEEKDKARDEYLKRIGITTFRIRNLEKESQQKTKFKELVEYMKSQNPKPFRPFNFLGNIHKMGK